MQWWLWYSFYLSYFVRILRWKTCGLNTPTYHKKMSEVLSVISERLRRARNIKPFPVKIMVKVPSACQDWFLSTGVTWLLPGVIPQIKDELHAVMSRRLSSWGRCPSMQLCTQMADRRVHPELGKFCHRSSCLPLLLLVRIHIDGFEIPWISWAWYSLGCLLWACLCLVTCSYSPLWEYISLFSNSCSRFL